MRPTRPMNNHRNNIAADKLPLRPGRREPRAIKNGIKPTRFSINLATYSSTFRIETITGQKHDSLN